MRMSTLIIIFFIFSVAAAIITPPDLICQVFTIRQDKGILRFGLKDVFSHVEQFGGGLRDGFGGAANRKGDRLMRLDIQAEKGLSHFGRL